MCRLGVRPVATEFSVLYNRGATRGYIALVRPSSFEEQVREQRLIRDVEAQAEERRGPEAKTVAQLEVMAALRAQGLSHREIAALTGIHKDTVRNHVSARSRSEAMRLKWQRFRERFALAMKGAAE